MAGLRYSVLVEVVTIIHCAVYTSLIIYDYHEIKYVTAGDCYCYRCALRKPNAILRAFIAEAISLLLFLSPSFSRCVSSFEQRSRTFRLGSLTITFRYG